MQLLFNDVQMYTFSHLVTPKLTCGRKICDLKCAAQHAFEHI